MMSVASVVADDDSGSWKYMNVCSMIVVSIYVCMYVDGGLVVVWYNVVMLNQHKFVDKRVYRLI